MCARGLSAMQLLCEPFAQVPMVSTKARIGESQDLLRTSSGSCATLVYNTCTTLDFVHAHTKLKLWRSLTSYQHLQNR
jgi:hypothetical protein